MQIYKINGKGITIIFRYILIVLAMFII